MSANMDVHDENWGETLNLKNAYIVYIHILSDIITYKDNMYVFVTYWLIIFQAMPSGGSQNLMDIFVMSW